MKPITGKRACELAELKGWKWKRITGITTSMLKREANSLFLSPFTVQKIYD